MLKKLCLIFLVSSCSFFQLDRSGNKKTMNENLLNVVDPIWFSVHESSSLKDVQGGVLPHLFFDINPKMNKEASTLDFVILTPSGAKFTRDLSLLSGQIYADKKLCPTSDRWHENKTIVNEPNFTMGFVPRLFNQLNEPQKIIVYGNDSFYAQAKQNSSHRVKLVGGLIYQTCPNAVCTEPSQWMSSVIFIAVDLKDEKYKKLRSLKDLLAQVDWNYSKVFLENSLGQRVLGTKEYAVAKVSSLININQVNTLIEKNSLFWSVNKITSIKKSCLGLYNKLMVSAKSSKDFFSFMREEYGKVESEMGTCFRYVYPQSLNDSAQKFSFMAYIQAYQHLHDLGYFYSCSSGGWQSNPMLMGGKRAVNLKTYRKSCLNSEIDNAIKTSVQYLENLLNKLQPSYQFLTYDNRSLGATHSKHYAWVPFDGRVSTCKDDGEKLYSIQKSTSFPRDIKWSSLIPKEEPKSLIIK